MPDDPDAEIERQVDAFLNGTPAALQRVASRSSATPAKRPPRLSGGARVTLSRCHAGRFRTIQTLRPLLALCSAIIGRHRMEHGSGRKAVIVGGSIGESVGARFAATALRATGWDASIFEQSPHDLDSRGGRCRESGGRCVRPRTSAA
ncbi:hypothetical protein [Burkholderia sp. AU15512]|uniref:hypothetical protein n=1 Tax=Burkholderia sp. AU15512 TaxID=2015345 RepID=UPI0015C64226|nr:hypothetical protein [Burkholderia sp. AU15512]